MSLTEIHTPGKNESYQDKIDYTTIENQMYIDRALVSVYRDLFSKVGISQFEFSDAINNYVSNNSIDEQNIIATEYQLGVFAFYLNDGNYFEIPLKDIQTDMVGGVLGASSQRDIERKSKNIISAMEYIYAENDSWLTSGELNNKDIVDINRFGADLKGKTLAELKELLDIEHAKLLQVYDITGEAYKKQKLLQTELKLYMGVGDKYEGGARYFSMGDTDIDNKIEDLGDSMNHDQRMKYLKQLHKSVDDTLFDGNYKKSDMVVSQNSRLFNRLYTDSFHRLKKEDAPTEHFIDLVKIMTGRGDKITNMLTHLTDPFDTYEDLAWDPVFGDMQMANEIMLYVMQRKGGIIETLIADKTNGIDEIVIEDKELDGKTPSQILIEANKHLGKVAKLQGSSSEAYMQQLGFTDILGVNKSYQELDFNQKVQIGALARINDIIKDTSLKNIEQDPSVLEHLNSKLTQTMSESVNALHESLAENFDGKFGLTGKDANDVGLAEGSPLYEMFNLYRDVNGNGLFDLSDDNWFNTFTWSGTAITALSMIGFGVMVTLAGAAIVAGSPVLLTTLAAGFAAGALTGIASTTLSKQGYDSLGEGAKSVGGIIAGDALLGAAFLGASGHFFRNLSKIPGLNLKDIDILVQGFRSKATWGDMAVFGGAEMYLNSTVVSPFVSTEVKKQYPENHFDANDGKKYSDYVSESK